VKRSSLVPSLRRVLLALLVSACGSGKDDAPAPPAAESLLAPALRRLSVAELEQAARSVLGTPLDLQGSLPPDALQSDFSRNIAQSVDSLTLRQLYDATRRASEAVPLADPAFPSCAAQAQPGDTGCRDELLAKLATVAFRRPPSAEELTRLRALFVIGVEGSTFRDGAALVLRALLASPQLLYESSLGEGPAQNGARMLAQSELASGLSFMIRGTPPDTELLSAAAAGRLSSGSERYAQAVRLLGAPEAIPQFQRFVEEWLGLVQLPQLAKSSTVTTDFAASSRAMQSETRSFVADVLAAQRGSLIALFAGGYSIVPDELAPLYGIQPVPAGSRVVLRGMGRVGILQQGSFLSVFAHEGESAPVLRGKAVLTRVLCRTIRPPQEFGIDLMFPAPDANSTTRQRFERHAVDPVCRGCHSQLDSVGFSFENFDAVGRLRSTDAGQAVDTRGSITLNGAPLALKDSVELSDAIAHSEELRNCVARQVVRFASGRKDEHAEAAFVAEMAALPVTWRSSLLGLFLSYVKSDGFGWRLEQ